MGIKTVVTKEDINLLINVSSLKETIHGNSHTVYIVDDKYILKLYENVDENIISCEKKLLKLCSKLCVPIIKQEFIINQKKALLSKKAQGEVLKKVENVHIRQIAIFLKEFHQLTKNKISSNKAFYSKENLKKNINKTKNEFFIKEFNDLKINLNNDGIIHGDLFVDNAIFKDDKLTCVFDFSDSCNGDFLFDLAVVALSWCKDFIQVKQLLKAYDESIKLNDFIKYIKYASLFYCVKRDLDKRNYDDIAFKNLFRSP